MHNLSFHNPQGVWKVKRVQQDLPCPNGLQALDVFNKCFDDVVQFGIVLAVMVDFVTRVHDSGMIAVENLADFGQ